MILKSAKRCLIFFTGFKLMYKLLISYFVLIILPLVLLSYLFYNNVADTVENYVTYSAKQAFEQSYSFLSYKVFNISSKSDLLVKDSRIVSILENASLQSDLVNQIMDMNQLSPFLASLEDKSDISRVRLYLPENLFYSGEERNLYAIRYIANSQWYKIMNENKKNYLWITTSDLAGDLTPRFGDTDMHNDQILSLAKIVLNPRDYSKNIGVVRFDFFKNDIVKILNKANTINNSFSYVQNSRGDVVATSSEDLLRKYGLSEIVQNFLSEKNTNWTYHTISKEDVLVGSRLVDNSDLSMITVIPLGGITAQSKNIRNNILILLVIIGTIASAIAYFISYSITKRIRKLAEKMRDVHDGRLEAMDEPMIKDEIGTLIDDYNYMTVKMSALIKEQYQSGQELKNAELKALQAQINPHFLYNTLDMINWYAWKNKGAEIITIVDTLAKFYKLSLSKGREIISIQEELAHVSFYFQIQGMRFKNNINLRVNVDESIRKYSILKITLQPLVENAILHGILCKESKSGTVSISSWFENETIILCVEDDGIGIPASSLDTIFSNPNNAASGSGYGIRNINSRIKLYYGDEYGLTYLSEFGKGTIVEIRIPKIEADTDI